MKCVFTYCSRFFMTWRIFICYFQTLFNVLQASCSKNTDHFKLQEHTCPHALAHPLSWVTHLLLFSIPTPISPIQVSTHTLTILRRLSCLCWILWKPFAYTVGLLLKQLFFSWEIFSMSLFPLNSMFLRGQVSKQNNQNSILVWFNTKFNALSIWLYHTAK